jgi:hypothetical protein
VFFDPSPIALTAGGNTTFAGALLVEREDTIELEFYRKVIRFPIFGSTNRGQSTNPDSP